MPSTVRGTTYGNSLKYLEQGKKYRVWWISGDEYLREELISRIRASLDPHPSAVFNLQTPAPELWSVLQSHACQLVVLRDAAQLEEWGPLSVWLEDKEPNQPTLVYSVKEPPAKELQDLITNKGRVVKGNPTKEEVASMLSVSPEVFEVLWKRVAEQPSLALSEGKKLELLPNIRPEHVKKLIPSRSVDVISDCLIKHQKKEALLVARDEQEPERVLARVGARLDQMLRLHLATTKGIWQSNRDLILASGLPSYVVAQFSKYAGSYGPKEYGRRARLLLSMDAALNAKNRVGVLEALITLW